MSKTSDPLDAVISIWHETTTDRRSFLGSGAFIAPRFIISAKHLFKDKTAEQIFVDLISGYSSVAVEKIHLCQDQVDIAVLELSVDFPKQDRLSANIGRSNLSGEYVDLFAINPDSETKESLGSYPLNLAPRSGKYLFPHRQRKGHSGGVAVYQNQVIGVIVRRHKSDQQGEIQPLYKVDQWLTDLSSEIELSTSFESDNVEADTPSKPEKTEPRMAKPSKNTHGNRERLQQKRKDLKKQWTLLQKKLTALGEERILETRSNEILRIDTGIKKAKADQRRVETQLSKIETQLEPKDEAPVEAPASEDAKPDPSLPKIPSQNDVIAIVHKEITKLFAHPTLQIFHDILLRKLTKDEEPAQIADLLIPPQSRPELIAKSIEALHDEAYVYLEQLDDASQAVELVDMMSGVLGWLILLTVSKEWLQQNAQQLERSLQSAYISIPLKDPISAEVLFARLRTHKAKFVLEQANMNVAGHDKVDFDPHFPSGFLPIDKLKEVLKAIWVQLFKTNPDDETLLKNTDYLEAQIKYTLKSRNRAGEHYHIVVPINRSRHPDVNSFLNQLSRRLPDLGVFLIEGAETSEQILVIEEPHLMVLIREFLLLLQNYKNEHTKISH